MVAQRKLVHEGSAIAKAIDYSVNRWAALMRFLDDGDIPIDNNWNKNRIRPISQFPNGTLDERLRTGELAQRSGEQQASQTRVLSEATFTKPGASREGIEGCGAPTVKADHAGAFGALLHLGAHHGGAASGVDALKLMADVE